MRGPVRRLRQWAAALAALTVLAACGEEPAPPRLTGFVPPNPSVIAGESVDIGVEYEANDLKLKAFQWSAEAGEIEGNGKPAITWRAPDTAGDYKLTVTTASAQEGMPDLSLNTVVKVLPASTPEPVVSEASPAADTAIDPTVDASAGQKAAAAARAALRDSGSEAAEVGKEAAEEAQAGIESAAKEVAGVGQEATEEAQTQVEGEANPAKAASPDAEPAGAGEGTSTPGSAEAPAKVAALTEGHPAASPGAASGVDAIVARGRLVAVVENDFPPFSFEEDGGRAGFDVDMMREFARRWLGESDAVTFVPVTSDQRIATLREGEADLIAAALTRTAAREELIDFSQTYFKDGQRILVAEDADIAGPCDLAGKKVAVIAATTSLDNIKAEAAACGFDIEAGLAVFEQPDQAVAALLAGEVEAFTSDGIALERLAEGQPLKVVGNHFSEEPYGFGITKGDERLRRLVDLTLQEMDKDGTYAAIYQKWFGGELSPYPLEAAASLDGDEKLLALATTDLPPLFEPLATKAPADGEYVVQPGDTLSTIAGKVFGDVAPGAWRAIWEANKATIGDDPNRIKVGMRLTIPASL
jgi:aspartate/glutamate/glutamine transport system substrate-binding protein